ncbi:MAG: hypothetical protein K2P81_10310 [Bacteriovoracaceae bacterium]|nr:hypothetical protein [Bacteriovoracaceae bacterium]
MNVKYRKPISPKKQKNPFIKSPRPVPERLYPDISETNPPQGPLIEWYEIKLWKLDPSSNKSCDTGEKYG